MTWEQALREALEYSVRLQKRVRVYGYRDYRTRAWVYNWVTILKQK